MTGLMSRVFSGPLPTKRVKHQRSAYRGKRTGKTYPFSSTRQQERYARHMKSGFLKPNCKD